MAEPRGAGSGPAPLLSTQSLLAERAAASAQVFVTDPARPLLGAEEAHHLLRVLRLRPGEVVVACDGAGSWCRCRLRASGGDRPASEEGALDDLLVPEGPVQHEPAPVPALTVAFAPVKGERAEWVVQKLTEIGVDRIVPVHSERSVVRWEGARASQHLERLRRVAREAAAQSRRVFLPEVHPLVGLGELAGAPVPWADPWLADPRGGALGQEVTTLAVGPEGGWSEAERAGAPGLVALGPTVLRAETAAVVAGTLLCALRAGTVAQAPAGAGTEAGSGPTQRARAAQEDQR